MQKEIKKIRQNFQKNIESVYDLMNFDELTQMVCIKALEKAAKGLRDDGVTNKAFTINAEIKQMKDIKEHSSLKPHYAMMLNQCAVLVVSYFSSEIYDILEFAFTQKIKDGLFREVLGKEEIKLKISELKQLDFNVIDNIGELLITKLDISCQDMQSIGKAFKKYFGCNLEQDRNVNNIILSHACRHSIVHYGGVASAKTIKQISNATPRDIKSDLKINDQITFNQKEIKLIVKNMEQYIDKLQKHFE